MTVPLTMTTHLPCTPHLAMHPSSRPGDFERVPSDALVCYLRGYAPLVNWADHVYARLDAMLRWREAERVDHALTDEGWVEPEAAKLFAQVLPCGPIGVDGLGHPVVLETPGASSALLGQLFEEMSYETFLRCQVYNKEATPNPNPTPNPDTDTDTDPDPNLLNPNPNPKQVYNKEVMRHYLASVSMAERRRLYKVINVVDLSGLGSTHFKSSTLLGWFKQYAAAFGLYYPETMYRTYVINAPMIFSGIWKIARNFVHPVTAAKISVSSWGHEDIFAKDGIVLFGSSIEASLQPWRSVAAQLATTHDLATLAAGCYTPPEDAAALAALQLTTSTRSRRHDG